MKWLLLLLLLLLLSLLLLVLPHLKLYSTWEWAPTAQCHWLCKSNRIFYALFLPLDDDVFGWLHPPYEYEYVDGSITNGWQISYMFGLLSVFCRPPGLDVEQHVELMLGASERHLSSVWCSPVWSLSSSELAAALGEMLGVRPPVRICDISEPRRLVIFLKPGPEQKHLHMIRLKANRKSLENSA